MKLSPARCVLDGGNVAEYPVTDFGPLFPILAQKPSKFSV